MNNFTRSVEVIPSSLCARRDERFLDIRSGFTTQMRYDEGEQDDNAVCNRICKHVPIRHAIVVSTKLGNYNIVVTTVSCEFGMKKKERRGIS